MCTSILGSTDCLKPCALAVSLYTPIGNCPNKYCPESFATDVYLSPLAVCSATTVAPGTNPPEASLTVPPSSPVFIWPNADGLYNIKNPMRMITMQACLAAWRSGIPHLVPGNTESFLASKTAPMNNPYATATFIVSRLQWAVVCRCKDVVKSRELCGNENLWKPSHRRATDI